MGWRLRLKFDETARQSLIGWACTSLCIRNKIKLRKYRQKLSLGNFTYKEVENNYKTIRQTYKHSNAKSALERMDSYYNSIFIKGGYWTNE